MATFVPPANVAANAQRALDVRETKPQSQQGMTAVGLARANQLAKREPVSLETVRRMVAYFDRHEVDKQGSSWGEQGKGWQAWYGWGGDEGRAWARRILKENDMEAKASRRHSEGDMKLIRTARKNLMDTLNVLVELGDDGAEEMMEVAEATSPTEPMKRRAIKNEDMVAALMGHIQEMLLVLQGYQADEASETESDEVEDDDETMMKAEEDRDTTPAERQDMPAGDFVFPDTRNFPVVTPDDIPAAVSSWGRYGGTESFETFKQKLIELATRKGQNFVDALPEEWLAEMETKSLDGDGTLHISEEMKALARQLLGGLQ
jgi:hypothetical protein